MAINKLPTSASLKEVIDKFEEISLQDFSSVNIITASELPSKGKEGQLCIITNITPNNIFLDYKERELSENDIFIQTNIPSNDNGYYKQFNVADKRSKISVYIRQIIQKTASSYVDLDGYIMVEGEWIKLIEDKLELYSYGAVSDLLYPMQRYNSFSNNQFSYKSDHIYMFTSNTTPSASQRLYTKEKINLSDYNYVNFLVDTSVDTYKSDGSFYFSVVKNVDLSSTSHSPSDIVATFSKQFSTSYIGENNLNISLDISSLKGEFYIMMGLSAGAYSPTTMKIKQVNLT